MPKVSIIMPVYNGERYLKQCLESIFSQTLQEIEILAIDNGSTDASGKILLDFAKSDARLRVISQSPNIGPSGARNLGLDQATGEYIAFCDCDDEVPQGAYAAMYDKCVKDGLDVVSADYVEVICWGAGTQEQFHRHDRTGFIGYMQGGAIWNRLFRRAFLEQHQLRFSQLSHGEDTLFAAQVWGLKAVTGVLQQPVYRYFVRREEKSSLAQHCDRHAWEEYLLAEREIYKAVEQTVTPAQWRQYARDKFFYLRARWWSIADLREKDACFPLLKELALQTLSEQEFELALYLSKDCFEQAELGSYLAQIDLFNAADLTLAQFELGGIGLRYLVRYFNAWMRFKMRKRRL